MAVGLYLTRALLSWCGTVRQRGERVGGNRRCACVGGAGRGKARGVCMHACTDICAKHVHRHASKHVHIRMRSPRPLCVCMCACWRAGREPACAPATPDRGGGGGAGRAGGAAGARRARHAAGAAGHGVPGQHVDPGAGGIQPPRIHSWAGAMGHGPRVWPGYLRPACLDCSRSLARKEGTRLALRPGLVARPPMHMYIASVSQAKLGHGVHASLRTVWRPGVCMCVCA